jgi:hypothetical protein
MHRSLEQVAIGVSGLVLFIAIFVIAGFYSNNQPAILEETGGDTTVYIEAARNVALFPGECISVKWEITGDNTVFIIRRGQSYRTTSLDSTVYCFWSQNPTLRVDSPDGSSSDFYTVEIEHLYNSPLILLLLLIIIVAACTFAYLLLGVPAVLVILTAVLFTPILSISASLEYDFITHINWAQIGKTSGNIQDLPPHFVFHYLAITITNIFPSITLMRASFLVVLFSQIGTVLGLYYLFLALDPRTKQDYRLKILCSILALALVWVGPISYFTTGLSRPGSSAFLNAGIYHNPTLLVMRMFAVWLFVTLVSVPSKWSKRVIGYLIAIVTLLLLSTFSKPSYTFVIVPAYLVLIGIQFLRARKVSKNTLLVAATLIIPATLAVGLLYFAVYDANSTNIIATENSKILIELFGLYRVRGLTLPTIIIEWITSLLFPISVYVLYIKKAWRDDNLNLAWIALFGAIVMAALFIEVPRTSDGNFTWGTRITTLIVFAVSASFLLRQQASWLVTKKDWRLWLSVTLFMAHALFYATILIRYFARHT